MHIMKSYLIEGSVTQQVGMSSQELRQIKNLYGKSRIQEPNIIGEHCIYIRS
jgi:hypothetical protein